MRFSATLLVLLLALPGLVLPAGFLWRICRCAVANANTGAATSSCCADHPVATTTMPPSTCCQPTCCQHCDLGVDRGRDGPAKLTPRSCKCVWVKVPDHQPKPVLPQQAPDPDAAALPLASAAVVLPLADTGRRLPRFEVARPPPRDHHRNHPLLL